MKILPDAVRPVRTLRPETTDRLPVDTDPADRFDAGLMRHVRLLTTAPIVRHQNQLWTHKWEIVRELAQQGPQTVARLLRGDANHGQAALDALLSESLVSISDETDDPRLRVVTLTQRGKTVLDTIRPPV